MIPSNRQELLSYVVNTISYFHFFHFAPSFEQIHRFFPKKIAKKQLKTVLNRLVNQKILGQHRCRLVSIQFVPKLSRLICLIDKIGRHNKVFDKLTTDNRQPILTTLYTLPQYSINPSITVQRHIISKEKLALVYCYTKALSKISFMKMVAITGSAAMGNCKKNDDVDMMIVTERGYLWISRLCAIILSILFNVRDLVCLNLFFDETDLNIPYHKQTPYVAHEILQMKTVINKDYTYERFTSENRWIRKIYPNSKISDDKILAQRAIDLWSKILNQFPSFAPPNRRASEGKQNSNIKYQIVRLFEAILKRIQLAIIRKNKTGLMITNTQLWLFKQDFEKKMRGLLSFLI